MDKQLAARVRKAVDDGVTARSHYYASIDLPDEQRLGAAAKEDLIAQLEQKIGRSLPPSYRTFLALHNGWRMVDGVTDLLPVEDLLDGPKAAKIVKWQQACAKSGDLVAANGLVIGWADINPTRLLLDPSAIGDDGEWRMLEHYKDDESDYPSFIEWLEQSVADYDALAEGEDDDDDEDA